MSVKEKILNALSDISLGDLGEERLIDVLMDAYNALQAEVRRLAGENAVDRQKLRDQMELAQQERRRMRTDPTYWTEGMWGFRDGTRLMTVRITCGRVELCEENWKGGFSSYVWMADGYKGPVAADTETPK